MNSQRWKRPFFTVWTGQAFSLLGSRLVSFALIWWLTESTGSATILATASLVTLLPTVVLGPFAGALVDRWSRRAVMIVADGLIALLTGFLAYLFWVGIAETWHVYVILFLGSFGGSFHQPAMLASTSLMVPEDQLTRVGGMNQTLGGILRIASPPLGALLLAALGVQGVLAIDIVTAVIAIAPLLFIYIPQPEATPDAQERRSMVRDVVEAFGYVWGWRTLFLVIITCALTDFFTAPAGAFLPLLVTRDFGGGALELAWMNAAQGVGIIAGGFILSAWGGFKRRIVTSLVGWAGIGLGCLGVGLAPATAFWLALAAMCFLGLMVPIGCAPLIAFYQSCVAPEKQGRFFTLVGSINSVMMPLGLIAGGPVADAFGVRIWWVLMGAAHILLAVVWVLTPSILHIEDDSDRRTVRSDLVGSEAGHS